MKRFVTFLTCLLALTAQAQHEFTIQAKKPVAEVKPTMYGIFFEDINFGADGGLYAELVENRSFEYPDALMGWEAFGNVSIDQQKPAFERNPHYAVLREADHPDRRTGLENHGYFGMGLRQGVHYELSFYARTHSDKATLRIELVNSQNNAMQKEKFEIAGKEWKKYTLSLTPNTTDGKGFLRLMLGSKEGLDLDHVSLMPGDNWNGLRADLVKDLEDLHPGIFRFPGGCIVEGTNLGERYQWKNTIGPAENRPLNKTRWSCTMQDRIFPNYFQSLGLGFYEFFLLAEKIGAAPLPILSCGLACQFQNKDDDPTAHCPVSELQPFIDDALDLIEFANGDVSTKWGKVRVEMGHPAPFNLRFIGIGNEQWGELYPPHLEPFIKAIRGKYPDIQIVGTSGPSASGKRFDYGWEQMRRLKVDLVDEHYYMAPEWFLANADRYDKYPRKGPKVFAGEYAAHGKERHNDFEAALSEAAFMTGLERNADVVSMATYAPLFAHVDGWQWRPDLIWFDNLKSFRSPNWYVQQLYGLYKGTHTLSLTENKLAVTGQDGLYASAVCDKAKGSYYVKIANTADAEQTITLTFKGAKALTGGEMVTLHADMKAVNSLETPTAITPKTQPLTVSGTQAEVKIGPKTFAVVKLQ